MTHGFSVSENVKCPDAPTVKVGDVFYESWGYDQTNVDFAQVVELSPTGKTAKCRMMSKLRFDESSVEPDQPYGEIFRLKVDSWPTSGEPELKGSYPFVQREGEESSKRFGYFAKYDKPVYETPTGMGH